MSSYRVVRRNNKYALVMDANGNLWQTNRFINVVCGAYVSLLSDDLTEVKLDKRLKQQPLPKSEVKYQFSEAERLHHQWWNKFIRA